MFSAPPGENKSTKGEMHVFYSAGIPNQGSNLYIPISSLWPSNNAESNKLCACDYKQLKTSHHSLFYWDRLKAVRRATETLDTVIGPS